MRISCRELASIDGRISIIIHGPPGCGMGYGVGDRMPNIRCTDLSDTDLIMGGMQRLKDAIRRSITEDDPERIFILSTCGSELIGEDIDALAGGAEVPIIALHTSGLCGFEMASEKGIALKHLLDSLPKNDPRDTDPKAINYFGDIWVDNNGFDDDMRGHLESLGIRTKLVMAGEASYDDIKESPNAGMSVFVDHELAHEIGTVMKKRFGQRSLVCPLPFGIRGTSLFFDRIAKSLSIDAREKIFGWEKSAKKRLARTKIGLIGKRAVVNSHNIEIARGLAELGMDTTIVGEISDRDKSICRRYGIKISKDIPQDYDMIFNPDDTNSLRAGEMRPIEQYLLYSGIVRFGNDLANALENRLHTKYAGHMRVGE
jgi:nitrogenase molybdenum-iron protein alpha/beta subunit